MPLMPAKGINDPSQRWKILAIPLLGALLVWRLWPSSEGARSTAMELATAVAEQPAAGASPAIGVTLPPVPEWSLADALSFDPLRQLDLNPIVVEEEVDSEEATSAMEEDSLEQQAEFEERVATLKSLKVDAILLNDEEGAALIGSRVIRVGDYLEEGARVIGINANGIRLRIESQETPQPSAAAESPDGILR